MASNAGPSALLEGTPYEGEKILGEGGMGVVIESRHRRLGRHVAVKLLHADLASEVGLVDRLRIEGQLLAQLASPYLVRVSDAGVTPRGDVYIVMERLFGRSLAEELKERGAIPWADAVGYVRQALLGLAVVHRAGVVHRDLKPANLFLCEAQPAQGAICKVLDFGIAKIVDGPARTFALPVQPTAPGMVVGSPRYMSPEQARGEPVDARSDVYSMGAVLYALVVGRGPFDDQQGFLEYCKAHVLLPPPSFAQLTPRPIPKELEEVVMRALSKNREDRFASAEAFVAALDALGAARRSEASSADLVAPKVIHDASVVVRGGSDVARPAPGAGGAEGPPRPPTVYHHFDALPRSLRAWLFTLAFLCGLLVPVLVVAVLKWCNLW